MGDMERYWIGFGDVHDDADIIAKIPGMEEAEGVIISGDLSNGGGRDEAKAVVDAVKRRNDAVYAQIGNMDQPSADAYLTEVGVNIHGRGLDIGNGVCLVGIGCSSPTPFNTPCEYPEEQLGQWLAEAYSHVEGCANLLLVAHDPPKDTKADQLPNGMHVGNAAVRSFIERAQPAVCLTGHIHEGRCVDRLGSTLIVNPGMLSAGGYAVLAMSGGVLTAELKSL